MIFTAGGTEADNHAMRAIAGAPEAHHLDPFDRMLVAQALRLAATPPRPAIALAMRLKNAALPNIIVTGTGPLAPAGVTSVIWISTTIDG